MLARYLTLAAAAAVAVVAHPDHTRHNCCVQYQYGAAWYYHEALTVNTCKDYYGNRATVDSGTCLQKPGISIDGSEFESWCQSEGRLKMHLNVYNIGAGYRGSC